MKTIFKFLQENGYEIPFISVKVIHARKTMDKYIKIERQRPSGYVVEIMEFVSNSLGRKRTISCSDYKEVIKAIR